jgi:hypothetical protein
MVPVPRGQSWDEEDKLTVSRARKVERFQAAAWGRRALTDSLWGPALIASCSLSQLRAGEYTP